MPRWLIVLMAWVASLVIVGVAAFAAGRVTAPQPELWWALPQPTEPP